MVTNFKNVGIVKAMILNRNGVLEEVEIKVKNGRKITSSMWAVTAIYVNWDD